MGDRTMNDLPNNEEEEEDIDDGLPELECIADLLDNLPELPPPLISGVLRQGHKMLIAGPSKAGKSYSLIELCISIAEGKPWLGFDCAQGKVLYVNLELDEASCLHRFKDVYQALGWDARHLHNLHIWNLRGHSVPMDKLAPKIIHRAHKKNFIAIVIDPIYKVITGNENSAYQMALFSNYIESICTSLGCAIVYCHHHSKGNQSWKKSMDRASGSGVFARDPDALLDIIDLELPPDIRRDNVTAWRITGTLREFEAFEPVDVWFNHPIHVIEHFKASDNVAPHSELPSHQRALNARKSKEQKLRERKHRLEAAIDICRSSGKESTIKTLADYLGVSEQTIRNSVDEHSDYMREGGVVKRVGR